MFQLQPQLGTRTEFTAMRPIHRHNCCERSEGSGYASDLKDTEKGLPFDLRWTVTEITPVSVLSGC